PSPVHYSSAFLPSAAGRTCHGRGPVRSGRQPVPALQPSCLQHRSARPRRHAVTKAVVLGSFAVVGLVGALHPSPPRLTVWRPGMGTRKRMAVRPVDNGRGPRPFVPSPLPSCSPMLTKMTKLPPCTGAKPVLRCADHRK